MVAAQVQIGRVVTVSLDAGRMEYVVDAQQTFEVAVGVHIAATAGAEAVFEDIGQFGIGVGGWQGVEVTACQYGVGAGMCRRRISRYMNVRQKGFSEKRS